MEKKLTDAAAFNTVAHVPSEAEALVGSSGRTPAQDLAHIRAVLKPAVTDLASTLGVSRQTIYHWLHGEPVSDGHAARLSDLAAATDVLQHSGMTLNAMLLRRTLAGGKTLMQLAQAGNSAELAARQLVGIHQRETAQRARMAQRFAHRRKTPATADFDLPPANDRD